MQTVTDIVAAIKVNQDAILGQINMLSRCMVGHNKVIRTSKGLYLRREGNSFIPGCITNASRWYPEDADTLIKELPRMLNWEPEIVGLHDALHQELIANEVVTNQLKHAALCRLAVAA